MMLLNLSQMFDGAPRLLSADELRKKFQQAGLDSSVVNFSNLELVIFPCSLARKKATTSSKYKNMRSRTRLH